MHPTGERLVQALRMLGWTKAELARRIHVSRQAINSWMTRGIPGARIFDIARALGVRPEWLATGEEPMHPAPTADDLDDLERKLLATVRSLPPEDRKLLLQIAEHLARR